jgi:hypothetical protein
MKLTEQQLAKMFQNIKNTDVENETIDLNGTIEASDERLSEVEKITNNSTLSASYQIINQLQDWSQAVGSDITLSMKPNFSSTILSWFKPTLATAAIVSAVYFITPNITAELDNNNNVMAQPDRIITTSFEGNNDIIKSMSFDQKSNRVKPDIISKNSFG